MVGTIQNTNIYRGVKYENITDSYTYFAETKPGFLASRMNMFIFENPNDATLVSITIDNSLLKTEKEYYLAIADKIVLSLQKVDSVGSASSSEAMLDDLAAMNSKTKTDFTDSGFSLFYPKNFRIVKETKKVDDQVMGKMVDGDLKFLEFENKLFTKVLRSEGIEIKIERYLHLKDYEPISPTGGGNIQVNSIICKIAEGCQDLILIDKNNKIYRKAASLSQDEYFYAKEIDADGYISRYMELLPVANDFDGFVIRVKFLNQDLSTQQKELYLQEIDKMVLSLEKA